MVGSTNEEKQLLINREPGIYGGVLGYPRYYIPRRHIIVLLCFLATLICYWLRTNMSVAIIPMSQDHFHWSEATQGLILSSFFWGYICLQFPGSWIATKFGPKLVLGVGVLWTSLFTLLTPFAAPRLELLFLCRFCTGFAEAVTYPVISMLISEWAHPTERTRFLALIWCGGNLGTVIAMLTSSPLITFFGYENLFFLNGGCGIVWSLVWFALAANVPREMVGICEAEIQFIHQPTSAVLPSGSATASPDGKPKVTLKTITMLLSNIHVWAIIIANFCTNWGFYVLLMYSPKYMTAQLNFNLNQAGFLAVLPYMGLFFVGIGAGRLADYLVKEGVDLTMVRKTFGILGCALPAFFLIGLSFISQVNPAVTCMVLAVSFHGLNYSSYGPNMLDIAPKYAGVIFGISNTFGTIPGIVGVYLTGWMLGEFHSWPMVFILASIVYLINCVTWGFLATAKRLY